MELTLNNLKHYTFGDDYYANEYGEVFFNKDTGRGNAHRKKHDKVKSFINKYGYVEYILKDATGARKHIQAHRITASLFIPQENKASKYVNHIDGDKKNNHVSNLEWCTAQENELHSVRTLGKTAWNLGKRLPSGFDYKGPIRTVYRFSLEGKLEKEYFNPTLAEEDGYNLKHISACCNGSVRTHKNKMWSYQLELTPRAPKRTNPGVSLRKDTGKYQATVHYKGAKYSVGCHDTLIEAVEARNRFLDEHPEILIEKTKLENIL